MPWDIWCIHRRLNHHQYFIYTYYKVHFAFLIPLFSNPLSIGKFSPNPPSSVATKVEVKKSWVFSSWLFPALSLPGSPMSPLLKKFRSGGCSVCACGGEGWKEHVMNENILLFYFQLIQNLSLFSFQRHNPLLTVWAGGAEMSHSLLGTTALLTGVQIPSHASDLKISPQHSVGIISSDSGLQKTSAQNIALLKNFLFPACSFVCLSQ